MNGANGTKVAGGLSIVVGLVLLGMCLSQWTPGTGSAAGQAASAYSRGDIGALAAANRDSDLNETSRTVMEGVAGVFWLGIGAFLLKKAAAEGGGRLPPRRR